MGTRHSAVEGTTESPRPRKYPSPLLPDALLTRGVAAGLVGGLAFIPVNMFAAQSAGKLALIAPLLRSSPLLIAGGLAYGLALYLVDFQIIARLFFPWFVDARGPNQLVELIVHPLAYGLVLVPFFLSVAHGRKGS